MIFELPSPLSRATTPEPLNTPVVEMELEALQFCKRSCYAKEQRTGTYLVLLEPSPRRPMTHPTIMAILAAIEIAATMQIQNLLRGRPQCVLPELFGSSPLTVVSEFSFDSGKAESSAYVLSLVGACGKLDTRLFMS